MNKHDIYESTVENYLSSIVNALDVAIFSIHLETNQIISTNSYFCDKMQLTQSQMLHKNYRDVFCDEFTQALDESLAQISLHTTTTNLYYWNHQVHRGQVSAHKINLPSIGDIAVFSVTNITNVSRDDSEYKHMTFFDKQLELPNGLQLEEDIDALENFDQVALVHFDIDRFSTINDVYGWATGDSLLLQIRDWILSTSVPGCALYRVDHDEFALLITGITLENAKKRASQVLERFSKPWQAFQQSELPLYCTITMGVAYGEPLRGEIRSQLFRTLHSSSKPGGYTLYNAWMDRQYKEKLRMRQTLISSVQQDMLGFSLRYQPIVDAKTLQWAGVEVLSRWKYPGNGSVVPSVFIQDLEQLGLIARLDDWVLKTAIAEYKAHGLMQEQLRLSVNLSPLHNIDREYVEKLASCLNEAAFPPCFLGLEITESNRFNFSSGSMQHLQTIADMGVKVVLDDFGTGYSSFDNLMKLPATTLKVDPSFIENLEKDAYLQYLLQVIIDLAHTANMRVIAEGVETEWQRDLLISYGADFLQGYLFGRPVSIDNLCNQMQALK